MNIRPAQSGDADAVWAIMEPIVRAGETYALPRDMQCDDALAFWFDAEHEVFVAEDGGVVGTYFMRPNKPGGGSHLANCAYMTAGWATGRGIARGMGLHSIERAKARGFRAMQFNFVVSTNERAVRLWQSLGFEVVGRSPEGFAHPEQGYVDALVMYRRL